MKNQTQIRSERPKQRTKRSASKLFRQTPLLRPSLHHPRNFSDTRRQIRLSLYPRFPPCALRLFGKPAFFPCLRCSNHAEIQPAAKQQSAKAGMPTSQIILYLRQRKHAARRTPSVPCRPGQAGQSRFVPRVPLVPRTSCKSQIPFFPSRRFRT